MAKILAAFEEARSVKGKPTVIIMDTVKGKGVSFMENEAGWHGRAPKPDEGLKGPQGARRRHGVAERLLKKGGEMAEKISLEYGAKIPKEKRPYWWNSQERMKVEMRATRMGFGDALEKAGEDPRVVAFGADISDSICISQFYKPRHPERKARWISVGIAEQNMTTMAAGLAKEGKIPVIGSYGVFATGRNWTSSVRRSATGT